MKRRVLALAAWAMANGYHTQVNTGLRGTLVQFTNGVPQLYSGQYLPAGDGLPETWGGAGIRATCCINLYLPFEEITTDDTRAAKQLINDFKTVYPPGAGHHLRYRTFYQDNQGIVTD